MKIYIATAIACWAALTTQTAAKPEWFWKNKPSTAPPPTKEIQLDYDIVPTWSQLGTTSKTKKIRLWRVYFY